MVTRLGKLQCRSHMSETFDDRLSRGYVLLTTLSSQSKYQGCDSFKESPSFMLNEKCFWQDLASYTYTQIVHLGGSTGNTAGMSIAIQSKQSGKLVFTPNSRERERDLVKRALTALSFGVSIGTDIVPTRTPAMCWRHGNKAVPVRT